MCGHTLAAGPSITAAAAPRPARVAPGLFFGSYECAARPGVLASLGITRVLSLVPGGGALYPHSVKYEILDVDAPDYGAACGMIGASK